MPTKKKEKQVEVWALKLRLANVVDFALWNDRGKPLQVMVQTRWGFRFMPVIARNLFWSAS